MSTINGRGLWSWFVVSISVAFLLTRFLVAPAIGQKQQIVTVEVTAPDGQKFEARGIVGGNPIKLERNGDIWTLHITAVKTK